MRVGLIVRGGVEEGSEDRNAAPIFVGLIRRLASAARLRIFSLHGPNRVPLPSLLGPLAPSHCFAGADVFQLGTARAPRLRLLADVARVVAAIRAAAPRSDRPQVLHGIGLSPGVVATAAGRLLGIPSVVSLIGGELTSLPEIGYGELRTAKGRAIVKTLLGSAGTITVASRFMQGRVERHGGQARVMPFGIDVRRFLGSVERPDGPPYRLLHVGTLCPLKDQLTPVRAVRALADGGLEATLDLVGYDDWQDRVQGEVDRLSLNARVRFHGWKGQDDVVALARSAHAFVMTSLDDVAPAAVLEAAAAGLPVVGTEVGFIADWAPEMAVATPVGDAAALAVALRRVLTHREERERMAARARDWVRAHASLDANDAFLRLYREVAEHAAPVPSVNDVAARRPALEVEHEEPPA
jgi:glycosyltransferase involved in cell wall biosynthesis